MYYYNGLGPYCIVILPFLGLFYPILNPLLCFVAYSKIPALLYVPAKF